MFPPIVAFEPTSKLVEAVTTEAVRVVYLPIEPEIVPFSSITPTKTDPVFLTCIGLPVVLKPEDTASATMVEPETIDLVQKQKYLMLLVA